MRPATTVELSDGRVRLRPWTEDDASELVAAVRESVSEVGAWMPWCHADYQRAEADEWIGRARGMWEQGTGFQFVVRDAESRDILGSCGLNNVVAEHRMCNLGYWIRSSQTGRGAATASVRLVARFGVEEAALNRIEIVVDVRNAASLRVAEKAGARREGILRERLVAPDGPQDAVMFSLLAADLRH